MSLLHLSTILVPYLLLACSQFGTSRTLNSFSLSNFGTNYGLTLQSGSALPRSHVGPSLPAGITSIVQLSDSEGSQSAALDWLHHHGVIGYDYANSAQVTQGDFS